jgi:raffinose/stachyose/melibiose transport system permease protein
LIFAAIAAFAIARSRRKWANIFYYIFLCGLVIPVAFIPTYLVLDRLNLLNSYLGLILVSATYGLPMSIFLYVGFMKTIPRELDEAAMLDGCPPLRMLFKIIIPLLKPVSMTLLIFNFVGSWNDIQVPLYFSKSDKWALPLTVYNFYGAHSSAWNLIFADIIITVLPLLILYLFGQKYIISGMTAGAVKS